MIDNTHGEWYDYLKSRVQVALETRAMINHNKHPFCDVFVHTYCTPLSNHHCNGNTGVRIHSFMFRLHSLILVAY